MSTAEKILKALNEKLEIDYCGLFENEVIAIIEKELTNGN